MLLSHAYVFEDGRDPNILLSFGAFLLVLFLLCLFAAGYWIIKNRFQKPKTLLITRKIARSLPEAIVKELCIIYGMAECQKYASIQIRKSIMQVESISQQLKISDPSRNRVSSFLFQDQKELELTSMDLEHIAQSESAFRKSQNLI